VVSYTLRSLLLVAALIKLGAGRRNNHGLIAGSGKTIFPSSKHPYSLRAHLEFYPLEPGGEGGGCVCVCVGGGGLSSEFEDHSAYSGRFPYSRVDPHLVF
jgi:hypothetical protein